MTQVYALHKRDPNFPLSVIDKIELFLGKPSSRALPPVQI